MLSCENCDKDLCEYEEFSCKCWDVPLRINGVHKCSICTSSGYDCECAESFIMPCKIKKDLCNVSHCEYNDRGVCLYCGDYRSLNDTSCISFINKGE